MALAIIIQPVVTVGLGPGVPRAPPFPPYAVEHGGSTGLCTQ